MKAKKLIATGLVASMLMLALTGCGAGGNSGESAKDTDKGSVYFLNFKSELSSEWKEVAGTFTKETGIDMKVVTAGSGTYEQTLKSELSKKEMPTLFNINGPIGYQTWKNYCADLKDSQIYEWLADKDMAITDGDGVYGIPYAVEGYGIIYNDAIMKKYFALPDKAVDISDTKEIKNFDTLKTVVEDMTEHKNDLGIQGVFGSTSFAPGEDWRWQTHLMNLPVYYEYKADGVDNLDAIEFKYNKNFKNIFDLYLNNSCTEPSMVGSKNVEESMAEFAMGNVAMIQNGNLQAPVLFFLLSGRLFLWLPEVPDNHPPLSIQRRFRCNLPAHSLSFPNDNTRNAPDSFPLLLCKNSAGRVPHTENGFCAVPFLHSSKYLRGYRQSQQP